MLCFFQEQEIERELPEYHQFASASDGMLDYFTKVRLARRLYRKDREFLAVIQSPKFEAVLERQRQNKAILSDLARSRGELRVCLFFRLICRCFFF